MSGGEKSRCALSCLTFKRPHILLLDEPTNHLDLDAIEQLEQALETFVGTVLLVTHDRALLEQVEITRTLDMFQGRCVERV